MLRKETEDVWHGAHDDRAVIQARLLEVLVLDPKSLQLLAEAAAAGDQGILV
jgi:hypothetical protein